MVKKPRVKKTVHRQAVRQADRKVKDEAINQHHAGRQVDRKAPHVKILPLSVHPSLHKCCCCPPTGHHTHITYLLTLPIT